MRASTDRLARQAPGSRRLADAHDSPHLVRQPQRPARRASRSERVRPLVLRRLDLAAAQRRREATNAARACARRCSGLSSNAASPSRWSASAVRCTLWRASPKTRAMSATVAGPCSSHPGHLPAAPLSARPASPSRSRLAISRPCSRSAWTTRSLNAFPAGVRSSGCSADLTACCRPADNDTHFCHDERG